MKRNPFITIIVLLGLLLGSWADGPTPSPASLAAPAAVTYYVKEGGSPSPDCLSWATACELQVALSLAAAGDKIWVAAGTYLPDYDPGTGTHTGDRNATFQLVSGVELLGGFPATGTPGEGERDWEGYPTTLSGDIGAPGNSDNSYHVVTGSGTDASAVLDGFTITGGNADGDTYNGGGMVNVGGSPTLRNLTFSGNSAWWGGGMRNEDSSSPTLTNVTFSDNAARGGGGMHNEVNSSPVLSGTHFLTNYAWWGGGMHNGNGSNPRLTNVTFIGNTAGGGDGGGMHNDPGSSPELTNVTFISNTATVDGGGMANRTNSNPTLTNVTFSDNHADDHGGGIYNWESSPTLRNCILWGNTATSAGHQIYNSASTPDITYSNVEGSGGSGAGWDPGLGTDGGGNLDADPLFVDAAAGNLRLQLTSPAIDAGDNVALPPGVTTDLDGYPRIGNSRVDMGAYEFQYPAPPNRIYVDVDATGTGDGSDWSKALTSLRAALAWAAAGITEHGQQDVEIWVAEGSYKPIAGAGQDATFQLHSGVAVYGGFTGTEGSLDERNADPATNNTVLSGDIGTGGDNSDNSYHVVTGSGTDASAVLDGFTITGGNASGSPSSRYGGGMYNDQGSPTLANVTFTSNTADYGGGMYNYTSSPELTHVTFSDNNAVRGGGMYNEYASSPELTKVTFSGNTGNAYGGGMFNAPESSPVLSGTHFFTNTAESGGGMYNTTNSSPTLTDCTFIDNTATYFGGGMRNYSSSPTLTHTIFISNSATYGGGMYNNVSSSPVLTMTRFISNTATSDGGGMWNAGSPTLTAAQFISNTASVYGGGMWNSGSLTLTATQFISNTALAGGGIYNDHSSATLTNCTLSGNRAGQFGPGGGMYNYYSSPTLTHCTLRDNRACDGGGMFNEYSSPTLTNCTLSGNRAAIEGGGMRNTNGSPTLTNVTFLSNTAGGDGGGMCNLTNSNPTLTNVEFIGNETGNQGGGMRNASSSPALTNVTFSGNAADYSGGGMHNENSSNPTITNVTFSGNTAGSIGGGMSNDNSNPTLTNSIFWGNTATSDDQIHNNASNPGVTYCLVQGGYPLGTHIMDADPLFADPDGPDSIRGTLDDDLHLLPGSPAIDAGDNDAPGLSGITTDLDGNPRIYGGDPDPQVDLGAYEAQCHTWHMHHGYHWLEEGQKYRLGFHADLMNQNPPEDSISGTLESYASQQAGVKLDQAREHFEAALACADTVSETNQALAGLLEVIWEQATAAMLQGNEEMVGALDLVDNDPADLSGEIAQLQAAIGYFDEATAGYLQPLTGDYGDLFLAALQLTRTHPLSDTQRYVDLERLSLVVAQKSRATLELAERQFRDGQRAEAEGSLREGQNAALAELTLLHTLWPEVVEEADYRAVLRNMTDMTRIYSYLVGDKNPFGYDPGFVPFHFDYRDLPDNNYEQTYDLADADIGDAELAVAAAQGKQEEIDDNYVQMQTRLQAAQDRYDGRLQDLCGGDLVYCSGGDVQTQRLAVEGAMLRMEEVVGQMEMQVELVRIEQTRAATVAGIHRATAQMITAAGEALASLAAEEAQLRFARSDTQGILGIVKKYLNVSVGTSGVSGSVSDCGWIGALFEWAGWEAEKDVAEDLAGVYAAKERLYALQKARAHYAEGWIVEADSLALIRKYFLELGQLEIDYAIARNDLMQELSRLTSLQGQVQYLSTEKAKAEAFTALLFQDPAGRVLREHYVEIANDEYERALETTFEAGRALEYEINQDVPVDGAVLHNLDDLYALQDTVDLRLALDDIDDAYDDWRFDPEIGAPQVYPDEVLYLSEAVGFVDSYDPSLGRIVTKEEKFNAFIRDAGNRVDLDGNGSAESLKFAFQTSILAGNPAFETGVFNDRILAINMRVRGVDLGVVELKAKLTQGGTSLVRTRDAFQECDPEGRWIDDLRTYRLEPKTATIRAFANDEPFPAGATSYELATRSVASTNWTLLISKCSDQQNCGPYWIPGNLPLNLDNIDEIELILDHEAYTLQAGQYGAAVFEPLPSRPYRPMEHVLPPLSLKRSPLKMPDQIHTHPSTAMDLNDTYVGAVVISQPLSVDSIELVLVLTDTQGSLSGYISPTLSYPAQGNGLGPAVSGWWAGESFGLQSEAFHTELSGGIVITRQVILHSGVISDSGEILTGVYSETQAGLTPGPLEIVGEFRLDRPSHELVAAFGASPAAGTVPLTVQFQDLSLGNPTTWAWDFGDGGTASEQHPTYTYTQPGTYTVTLTVSNAFGTGMVVEAERIVVRWPRVYLPLVLRNAS